MMTLALVIGSSLPSTVVGTFSRNSSSWRESTSALPSYQLPAWVASRVLDCGMFWMWFEEDWSIVTVEQGIFVCTIVKFSNAMKLSQRS